MKKKQIIEQFNLRSGLRFDIETGHIWLQENRMLLLHTKALGEMRRELYATLGQQAAEGIMFRLGFTSGSQDAELAYKLYGEADNYDVFNIGPELHAFEGLVKSIITTADINWEEGSFFGEVEFQSSWEAESHIQHFGIGKEPCCSHIAGYASGFVTQFFKRYVVFKETKCIHKGDDKCVMVGKPAEAWDDDVFVDYFNNESSGRETVELEKQLKDLRGQKDVSVSLGGLIGVSSGFRDAFDLLSKAVGSPISVLLLGETGVGKEKFAQWLHDSGCRTEKPFITINCAAIPNDLIESELFGVRRGAFTGAQESRPGRFERADGGTLFLDEVGELSLAAQAKLLRVLQTGEVERLGDSQLRKVNVRLVAATNVNLNDAMNEGRFRSDLYYRIATYPVEIPPLRERQADIPLLASAIMEKCSESYQKQVKGFSDKAMDALLDYYWPGNIRELENLIERGLLLVPDGGQIEIKHLFANTANIQSGLKQGFQVDQHGDVCNSSGLADNDQFYDDLLDNNFNLQLHERLLYQAAVRRAKGNLTHAAKSLGITRRQLAYKVKKDNL